MRSIVMVVLSLSYLLKFDLKVDRHSVGAAYDNSNALVRLGAVSAGKQRREGRRPSRLGDDSQYLPERRLRFQNFIVCHQRDAAHISFSDRKHQGAYSARGERVRRDPPG